MHITWHYAAITAFSFPPKADVKEELLFNLNKLIESVQKHGHDTTRLSIPYTPSAVGKHWYKVILFMFTGSDEEIWLQNSVLFYIKLHESGVSTHDWCYTQLFVSTSVYPVSNKIVHRHIFSQYIQFFFMAYNLPLLILATLCFIKALVDYCVYESVIFPLQTVWIQHEAWAI